MKKLLGPKAFSRDFELQIAIPPFNDIPLNIIGGIERDELLVFDAGDEDAFCDDKDIIQRAKTPVSIREWLCIGCQSIRWSEGDEFKDPQKWAVYAQNAHDVIFPLDAKDTPPGPADFYGAIVLNKDNFSGEMDTSIEDKRSFVIAHELTHVFDMLRILIPAFQDWPTFWERALQDGDACGAARYVQHGQSLFVDAYGTESELKSIEQYWPTNAKRWFEAFRCNKPTQRKNQPF